MNIIKASQDFGKQDLYKLTHNRSVSLKDAVNAQLTIDAWLYYSDVNQRGTTVDVLVLMTADGGYYSTISQTFINEFLDIADAFPLPVGIVVVGGTSKNGRDFISCELA